MSDDLIHVFIGTKAQYIKTSPLLRLMESRNVPYRLIDSGQHAKITASLRQELNVRSPELKLQDNRKDVESILGAVLWATNTGRHIFKSRQSLLDNIFGGAGGVCLVHGDTPTTLISTLLAYRSGLTIAHLESGLTSGHLWHPFPEEVIRRIVARVADLLFAPHEKARDHLRHTIPSKTIVTLSANTTVESLRHALGTITAPGDGAAIITSHRVENLTNRSRLTQLVRYIIQISKRTPVKFITHGPTRRALINTGLQKKLTEADVDLVPLMSYRQFAAHLARARFVITDGGSIQEECYYLGTPTLLWRKWTERPEGLQRNVVLSKYREDTVRSFLASPQNYRFPPIKSESSPSEAVLAHLQRLCTAT